MATDSWCMAPISMQVEYEPVKEAYTGVTQSLETSVTSKQIC